MKEIGTWDMPMVKVPSRMKLVRLTLVNGTTTCVMGSESPSIGTVVSMKASGLRMLRKVWASKDGQMVRASKVPILMAKRMASAYINGKMVLHMKETGSIARLMVSANTHGPTTVSLQVSGRIAK